MKYTVLDNDNLEVSFEMGTTRVVVDTAWGTMEFTEEQFKDFRKAVGYVWQEVHDDGDVHSN